MNDPAEESHQDADQRGPQPSFEASLAELQQIVADLEEGDLGLEESMQRFEKGVSLLRQCYKTLEQAEQRIEILTRMEADGTPRTEPFSAENSSPRRAPTSGRRRDDVPAAESPSDEAPPADGPSTSRRSEPGEQLF